MKRFVIAAAVSAAVFGWSSTPARAQSVSTTEADSAAELVTHINDLRSGEGLRPLAVHGELAAKATGWARTMAGAGRIWHSVLSDGVTVDWVSLGENVGTARTAAALHRAFVNSPRHYENLVRPDFDFVGIGVADLDGVLYAAEVFMRLRPAAAAPVSEPKGTVPVAPAADPAPGVTAAPGAAPSKPKAAPVAPRRRIPATPVRGVDAGRPGSASGTAAPTGVSEPAAPPVARPESVVPARPRLELVGHEAEAKVSAARPVATGVAAVAWMAAAVGLVAGRPRRTGRRPVSSRVSSRRLRRLVGPCLASDGARPGSAAPGSAAAGTGLAWGRRLRREPSPRHASFQCRRGRRIPNSYSAAAAAPPASGPIQYTAASAQ